MSQNILNNYDNIDMNNAFDLGVTKHIQDLLSTR